MTYSSDDIISRIDELRFNPAAIQRMMVDMVEDATDGNVFLVDPTNPFVFLLEAAVMASSAAMIQNTALNRKQYASVATTEDELYLHMSDADYAGRFAQPGRTEFTVMLGKEELYSKAVTVPGSKVRKLIIPRHTVFSVAGYKFGIQYPIEVRIMAHGGLQVVYDTSVASPLETLESNTVDWSIQSINGIEFVMIRFPVKQLEMTTFYGSLTSVTGFNTEYRYSDKFHYARCHVSDSFGNWTEITTTHTDQVYDAKTLTAALKVKTGVLGCQIPQIYFTNGLADNEFRIDIYTTKGPAELILNNYEVSNFTAKWLVLPGEAESEFVAPLSSFSTIAVFSEKSLSGGTDELSFTELRERVIRNSLGVPDLPISDVQLSSTLSNLGYGMVKDVDNITRRTFLATRSMPVPSNGSTTAPIGTGIKTFTCSLDSLRDRRYVKDNGNRITLLPDMLYESKAGVVSSVSDASILSLRALTNDALITQLSERNFLYSPFHYVLDINNDRFDSRAYYLDSPTVTAKSFIAENETAEIEVAIGSYDFERTVTGWRITVVTRSGDTFKALPVADVTLQLSFVPQGEVDRACLNATWVGTNEDLEHVYEFVLETNYDINMYNELAFTNFNMFDTSDRIVWAELDTKFDISFTVANYQPAGLLSSGIDLILGRYLLPEQVVGVVQEQLYLKLGTALDNLWNNSRSVIGPEDYQRYVSDVPWTYETDVYEIDPNTGTTKIIYNATTGEIGYNKLHNAGDPLLDDLGAPMIRFTTGDIKYVDGDPVVVSTRGMTRQVDIMMLEGSYYFVTEESSAAYRQEVPEQIVDWLNTDIASISKKLLEGSNMWFYPKTTIGTIKVMVADGQETYIEAEQTMYVKFSVNAAVYSNSELRAAMTKSAITVIAAAFEKAVVSIDQITTKLKAVVGDDAIAIDIYGLGGEALLTLLTVMDDSSRCSVGKRVLALSDGTLGVQDSITVDFVRHTSA